MSESENTEVDVPVIERIVERLSEVTGKDVYEIQPLHNSVDGQALEDLFSRPNSAISVVFTHEGHEIRVESNSDFQVTIV